MIDRPLSEEWTSRVVVSLATRGMSLRLVRANGRVSDTRDPGA